MSAPLPAAAARKMPRSVKRALPRGHQLLLAWNRAVHRMLDTPTTTGFGIQRRRCEAIAAAMDANNATDITQRRWDLR